MKLKNVFRYPGGKSKIAEEIVKNILPYNDKTFVDVFVGGGSVSIEMLNKNNETKLVLNDLDKYVYSFWNVLCSNKTQKLIDIIEENGEPTVKKFTDLREILNNKNSEEMMAFLCLFFNRTAFSGIFRSGPIGGYDQKGKYKIDCRYNKDKILSNIWEISTVLRNSETKCYNKDFREIIKSYGQNEKFFLYLDPPYMKQGGQLYSTFMKEEDYREMASSLRTTKCKWIVSHDNYERFIDLFKGWANIADTSSIPYTINSIKDNRRKELLISNFDLCFNKRSRGRPLTSNNIYKIECVLCNKKYSTSPFQMEKYATKRGINIMKVKNLYVCRECRRKNNDS